MTCAEWEKISYAERLLIEDALRDAPVRISAIAKALGVTVVSADLGSGISGEIRPSPEHPGSFIIRVNKNDSTRRQRFTVAHELGHYLLHRSEIGRGIVDDVLYRSSLSDWREAQANRIAADILMPDPLIEEWYRRARELRVDDVVAFLADKFNVSRAAMRIRLGIS